MGRGGKKTPAKSTFPKHLGTNMPMGGIEALAKSGALNSTLNTLGGIGGAASAMGTLLLGNQAHLVNGIKIMEELHREFLNENDFEGIMYSFSHTSINNTEMIAVLALPYNSEKKTFGSPLKVYNLGQFVQMLIESAQLLKK